METKEEARVGRGPQPEQPSQADQSTYLSGQGRSQAGHQEPSRSDLGTEPHPLEKS